MASDRTVFIPITSVRSIYNVLIREANKRLIYQEPLWFVFDIRIRTF